VDRVATSCCVHTAAAAAPHETKSAQDAQGCKSTSRAARCSETCVRVCLAQDLEGRWQSSLAVQRR